MTCPVQLAHWLKLHHSDWRENLAKDFFVKIGFPPMRTLEFLKFIFSKKVTNFDETFTVDLMLCSKCQIDGEDFVNFCGLLRKHEL